jgi:integrase
MGIIVICPKCGGANSIKNTKCTGKYRSGENKGKHCEVSNLKRVAGKIYAVDRKINGKRKRIEVGTSRTVAEEMLASMIAREKIEQLERLEKKPRAKAKVKEEKDLLFVDLIEWYISLESVKKQKAHNRVLVRLKSIKRILANQVDYVSDISVRTLEYFVSARLSEDSPQCLGKKISPKTCYEELNLIKSMINKAFDFDKISKIPVKGRLFPEVKVDNIRTRIFSEEEWQRMLDLSPLWMKRIIIMAHGTGMRQNEIIQLKWSSVDIEQKFLRLSASETKHEIARSVKLMPHVIEMLKEIPRVQGVNKVFLSMNNLPIPYWTTYCGDTFRGILKAANVEDATFHDLRHDFITRAMRAGNRSYKVMSQVGHKTDEMLRKYHLIDESDLQDFAV